MSHNNVRLESHVSDGAGVVGRSKCADEFRLGPGFDSVEDVNIEPTLGPDEGCKETDRTGAGHEHGSRLPIGALPHRDDLLPSLGDDCRGLEQHAQEAE